MSNRELTELLRRLDRFENAIGRTRQYIGARYVPKFIDDPWTDTIEYEVLSVVSVGGTSYISGDTVPVGTPISDRNHWHIYGASSGAIINLQNQIDDMKDGDVPGSLQNQIDSNVSDIESLADIISIATVAELIANTDLVKDEIVHVFGYTTVGDRGAADYIISDTSNDYSIALDNGLYANLISKGGITPQMFGIVSGESSTTAQPKWDLYVQYVNTTDMCYFLLPDGDYHVSKGTIIAKSMIGENHHPSIHADVPITTNFDDNKTTTHGYSYAVNGLLAVDDQVTSYIKVENLLLDCGQRCEVGLYIPEISKATFNDIRISEPTQDGLVLRRVWMCRFTLINVFKAPRYGFDIAYVSGIITSTIFENLYVQGGIMTYATGSKAYAIKNVHYSTFNSLACDGWNGTYCYQLIDIYSTSFNNIGFEACEPTGDEIIHVNSGQSITFEGVELIGCTASKIFYIAGNSSLNLSALRTDNCTINYYFDINGSITEGNYNINIGTQVTGSFRNNSAFVSYFLNTLTALQKCVQGVVHNLLA